MNHLTYVPNKRPTIWNYGTCYRCNLIKFSASLCIGFVTHAAFSVPPMCLLRSFMPNAFLLSCSSQEMLFLFLHCLTTQDNSYTCYRHHHCLTAQVNSYTCCRHHYCGYLSKPTAGRFSFVTHIKILSVRPSSSARERSVDLLFLLPLPDPPPSSFFLPPLIFLLTDRSVSHRQRWYTSNPSGKASL